jgi:hypothetical protein
MKRYELRNGKGKDIAFTGELLSEVDSRDFRVSPGQADRWTELRLYQTKGGKYICESCGRSAVRGETDRFNISVAETQGDVFKMFRSSYLSKALFEDAGLNGNVREVD